MDKDSRGFHQYGDVQCSYGEIVSVKESSAASPHCWLGIKANQWVNITKKDPNYKPHKDLTLLNEVESTAHINPQQAQRIIDKLTIWLEQIPERWDLSE